MEELLQEFDNYIGKELGKSHNTRLSYCRDVKLLFAWLQSQGISKIEDVTKADLQAYTDHLASLHKSNATISRSVASARQFFSFAKMRAYIFTDPSADLKAPKVIRKAPKIAQDTDIEKLLSAPDTTTLKGIRDRAMLSLMLSTGMRVSELLNLRVADVDLKKRIVKINGVGSRNRTVTYRKDISSYMQDYFLMARSQMLAQEDDDSFFVSCQGEKMTRQGFWKLLKTYGKACGIKEITPYTLRHSFAVYALKNGEDIHSVQSALGHSAVYSTTEYSSLL